MNGSGPAPAEVGLTDYAQSHLSDIVYVELPEVGASVTQGTPFGSIESVKAASDMNLPGQRHDHGGERRALGCARGR